MLQENPSEDQELPEFDDITGIVDEEPSAKEDYKEVVRVLTQGQELAEMQKTKGWGLIMDFIEGQVISLTNQLKVEKDLNKIIRLQSEVLAFESLPMILEKSAVDAEEARRRVNKLIEDQDPLGQS